MTGKELYWLLQDFRDAVHPSKTDGKRIFLAVNGNRNAAGPESDFIQLDMVDESGIVIRGTCPIVKIHNDGKLDFCTARMPAEEVGAVVALKRALDNK